MASGERGALGLLLLGLSKLGSNPRSEVTEEALTPWAVTLPGGIKEASKEACRDLGAWRLRLLLEAGGGEGSRAPELLPSWPLPAGQIRWLDGAGCSHGQAYQRTMNMPCLASPVLPISDWKRHANRT